MKFGTSIPQKLLMDAVDQGREAEVARVLQAIEDAGFQWLRVGDHIAFPGLSHHEGEDLDSAVYGDPFALIAWLGALNRKLRFLVGVLALPLRHPVLVAHAAATTDRLTGGRLDLGLGSGYAKQEFAALGVDMAERFGRTEDHVRAVRGLLDNRRYSQDGPYTRLDGVAITCRPHQAHLPIWVGGVGEQAADRAARLGDCFFPSLSAYGRPPGLTPRDLQARLPQLQARRRELGLPPMQVVGSSAVGLAFITDPRPLEGPADVMDRHVSGSGTAADLVDLLNAYAAAGLDGVVLDMHTEKSLEGCLRTVESFGEQIQSRVTA